MLIEEKRQILKDIKKYLSEEVPRLGTMDEKYYLISKVHSIFYTNNTFSIGYHKWEWWNNKIEIVEYQTKKRIIVEKKKRMSKWRAESIALPNKNGFISPLFFIIPSWFYSFSLKDQKISFQDINNIKEVVNAYLKENPIFPSNTIEQEQENSNKSLIRAIDFKKIV